MQSYLYAKTLHSEKNEAIIVSTYIFVQFYIIYFSD